MVNAPKSGSRRLLFISTSPAAGPGSQYGGGEHFASEFLQGLKEVGWDITLVCKPGTPFFQDESLMQVIKVEPLDLSIKLKDSPLGFAWAMMKWHWVSRRYRDHVFYANGYMSMKWAAWAVRCHKVQAVTHLHESTYEAYDTERTRRLAPAMARFFAISESVRNLFLAGSRISPERVVVIHNGVPVVDDVHKSSEQRAAIRTRFGLPADAPLVTLASRTDPNKGHEVLLKAAPEILRAVPETRFLLVGLVDRSAFEAEYYGKLRDIIDRLGLGERVVCHGHSKEVRGIFRASDIVVVPSTMEGFGRTAIEGMAERTATVTSDAGGLGEIITSGVDGLQFPSGDSGALAQALIRLLQDPAEREALAAAGHRTALERYSIDTMVGKIEEQLLAVQR